MHPLSAWSGKVLNSSYVKTHMWTLCKISSISIPCLVGVLEFLIVCMSLSFRLNQPTLSIPKTVVKIT